MSKSRAPSTNVMSTVTRKSLLAPLSFAGRTTCRFVLLLAAIALTPVPGRAGTTGILEGTVRDKENRAPLVGASVLVVGTTAGRATDIDGRFIIYNLPVGKYTLRVQMLGYKQLTMENVEIHADLRTRVTIDLVSSAVELGETVIEAQRPLIQRDIIGTTHMVSGNELNVMPVSGFQEVLGLQAGTTLEGNVRGGKSTEVLYLIDGLPVQDVLSGGLAAQLPSSSVVEMSVQTGGFEAEYGNAQSGIVNVITRTGSNEHLGFVRLSKDDLFGGTQNSRESEAELSLSGPVVRDKLFYFLSMNYLRSGTLWWQDFQHAFALPVEQDGSGIGKLDWWLSPSIRLSAQILYSGREWHDYEFSWRFNLAGLPPRSRSMLRGSLVLTHTLSDEMFYNIRLSAYRVENTIGAGSASDVDPSGIYQYDFFLQYITSGKQQVWSRTVQDVYTLKPDYTWQIASRHLVKAGGELNLYDIASNVVKYQPQTTYFGKPLLTEPMLNYSTAFNYFPKSGMAFLQEKYNAEDGSTVSIGLRYDFLNPMASRPAIEFVPTGPSSYRLKLHRTIPAHVKQQLSPRLGFSLPYAPTGYFFVNYGYYFQFPLFDYLYSGLDLAALQRNVNPLVGNPSLEPERTKAWEISVKQVLYEQLVGSVTYFKKESENQIDSKTFIPSDSKAGSDFGFSEYVNNPYAEASGVEVVLMRSQGDWITGDLSYTYMSARGLSESSNQGINFAQWGFTPPATPFYLSWDQRHTVKLNLSFHLPYGVQADAFFHYHSARPYTYYPSRDGFTPLDTTLVFVPNNARMEPYRNVDLKITKYIEMPFTAKGRLLVYVDARNLLNTKNVRWMDSSGRVGGELGDPSAYYPLRRVKVGMQFEITL